MLNTPSPDTRLAEADEHGARFVGDRGEVFRLDVLEEDIVRVRHWPDGRPRLDRTWMIVGRDGDTPREGRGRDDLTSFSRPACTVQAQPESVRWATSRLSVVAYLNGFRVEWLDAAGRNFAADLPHLAYARHRGGRDVFHFMKRRHDEHYYGFGEKSGRLDKKGRHLRMHNMDAAGYNAETSDPLYKHVPFYLTLVPELGLAYGILYDNLADCAFDLGCESSGYYSAYRYYHAEDGDIDYYLLFGPGIPEVLEKLAALTGRMALPPRWSLGYLGSTMAYTEAPDADTQLRKFAAACDQHRIPCDLFHLSSGYSTGADGKRYVFTWNRSKIPEPEKMTGAFHAAGIRLAANVKPCLLTTHPRYNEVATTGGFIRDAEKEEPQRGPFWGGAGSHIDFTHPGAYRWWQENLKKQLLDYGIDCIWNDNNEFPVEDGGARCHGFSSTIPMALARPLQTLLMNRAAFEAQRENKPDERPFVISRAGCPGLQRYAQTWTGDNVTSWNTLRYNIPMGLGLSLSGLPSFGHDTGGFCGPRPDPELFLRWVQNGIFHPRFCIHSANREGGATEPWMYAEVLPQVRAAIEFRYRMIPYLYSLFCDAADTGHPILRPLVYTFPEDPECRRESFNFMMGPHLLVASVLEPGARSVDVYLPPGRDWCDFHTGRWQAGGQRIQADAPLDRIPLFVPGGGIIPMGKSMRHVGSESDNLREIFLFPSPGNVQGTFGLVEDDGISFEYQRGGFTRLDLKLQSSPGELTFEVTCSRRGYPLPYDQLECILPPGEDRPVKGSPPERRDELRRRRFSIPV